MWQLVQVATIWCGVPALIGGNGCCVMIGVSSVATIAARSFIATVKEN
jgi:hypothetical protein